MSLDTEALSGGQTRAFELVKQHGSTRRARHARLRLARRVETWRDEPSGIWALLVFVHVGQRRREERHGSRGGRRQQPDVTAQWRRSPLDVSAASLWRPQDPGLGRLVVGRRRRVVGGVGNRQAGEARPRSVGARTRHVVEGEQRQRFRRKAPRRQYQSITQAWIFIAA